jgi:hypothetical protein
MNSDPLQILPYFILVKFPLSLNPPHLTYHFTSPRKIFHTATINPTTTMSLEQDDDEIPYAPLLYRNAPTDSNHHRVLSSTALDALKEFYADRDAQQKRFEELKTAAEKPLSMEDFAEDWNESQFWVFYSLVSIYALERANETSTPTRPQVL